MRAWVLTVVVMLWFWGCAAELPSAVPLGEGPRAEPYRDPTDQVASAKPDAGPDTDSGPAEDAAAAALPAATAAGDSPPADAGPPPDAGVETDAAPPVLTKQHVFAGDYSGEDTTTLRIGGAPPQSAPDPKARIKVTRLSDTEIQIVVIYTPTGNPFCTLVGEVKHNVATIRPGQTCPDAGVGAGFSGNVTGGTATVTGRRLVIDIEADIEVSVAGQTESGTLTYHFEGWRRMI